ncbi:MAG: carbon-nitrogen hydrolase family protein [Tissierellia bacterium]|nr:carbon-nitrogen hydrolase family protein [Tissierellia bacterium]
MKFTLAILQIDTQDNKQDNLKKIESLIDEAAEKGAQVISMAEMVSYLGKDPRSNIEKIPGGDSFELLSKKAKDHALWIHGGSIYEENPQDPKKPFNTTMVINPQGELVSIYRKLHLFDVHIERGPSVKESDNISAGDEIVTISTDYGKWGLCICYDMRFGEMFRLMALDGAEIFFVPANFTLNTGKDHWESLLRTRAIENSCYVVAAAQIGKKPKFTAYGRSLVVDPWGNIIAQASDTEGILLCEIDLDLPQKVSNQLYTLPNRRSDVYTLKKSGS